MRNRLFVAALCVLAMSSYAMLPFTYFWTISPSNSQVTTQKWRANNDSVLYWAGRVSDTLNTVVFKKSWMKDSTFDSIKVRKLRGDSIYTRTINALNFDSVVTSKTIIAPRATFTGVVNIDSIYARTGNIGAGAFQADSIYARTGRFPTLISNGVTTSVVTSTWGYFDKIGTNNSINADSINTRALIATNAATHSVSNTTWINTDSIKSRTGKFTKIIADTVLGSNLGSKIFGSVTIAWSGGSSLVYDTIAYTREINNSDTIIDLWFRKYTAFTASGTGLNTISPNSLPSWLCPTSNIAANSRAMGFKLNVISNYATSPGTCNISDNGDINIYLDTIILNKPTTTVISSFGGKGYFPFHVTYVRR